MSRRRKRERKKNRKSSYDDSVRLTSGSPCNLQAGVPAPAAPPVAAPGNIVHGPQAARNLPAAVPVFGPDSPYPQVCDEDGHAVYVTESEARQLMRNGRATFHRQTKHLRGIRIVPEILRSPQRAGSIRERSVTDPSDSADMDNARGCWSWGAPIYKRTNGEAVRVPATIETFRSLPKWAEEVLLEQRRTFLKPAA